MCVVVEVYSACVLDMRVVVELYSAQELDMCCCLSVIVHVY